jgi:hypothetical protein
MALAARLQRLAPLVALIVIVSAAEVAPVFPATSVARAVYWWLLPLGNGPEINKLQPPLELAVTLLTCAPPSKTVTSALLSDAPLIVNDPTLVMPSVFEMPLSGLMPEMVAVGATVSMVTDSADENDTFVPTVALATKLCTPLGNVMVITVHLPELSATAFAITSTESST